MTKTEIELQELRNTCEKGLTQEDIHETHDNLLYVVLSDENDKYHCHTYFTILDKWHCSVDHQKVGILTVIKWSIEKGITY